MTFRITALGVAIAASATYGGATAQTVNEAYASMCSDSQSRGSEACRILAEARAKSGQSAVVEGDLSQEQLAHRWGPLLTAVGRIWRSDNLGFSALSHYEWVVPGETMRVTITHFDKDDLFARSAATFRFDKIAGRIYYKQDASDKIFNGKVADDGSLFFDSVGDQKASNFASVNPGGPSSFSWNSFKRKGEKLSRIGKPRVERLLAADDMETAIAIYRDERAGRRSGSSGFMAAATGAIMGAATGYAKSGGSSVGAITGAMGGAVVGKAGGNDALYQEMEATRAQATADAEASQRQLQRTIAQGQRPGTNAAVRANAGSSTSAANFSGNNTTNPATGTRTSSASVQPWNAEVWCLATKVTRTRVIETVGSRTVEVDRSKVTTYKSQLFSMTITDLDEVYSGIGSKWRSYLAARQMPFDTAGCEHQRGQFDRYIPGTTGSGDSISEVIQTDFRM